MQAAQVAVVHEGGQRPGRLALPGAAWTNSLLTGAKPRLDLSSRARGFRPRWRETRRLLARSRDQYASTRTESERHSDHAMARQRVL